MRWNWKESQGLDPGGRFRSSTTESHWKDVRCVCWGMDLGAHIFKLGVQQQKKPDKCLGYQNHPRRENGGWDQERGSDGGSSWMWMWGAKGREESRTAQLYQVDAISFNSAALILSTVLGTKQEARNTYLLQLPKNKLFSKCIIRITSFNSYNLVG